MFKRVLILYIRRMRIGKSSRRFQGKSSGHMKATFARRSRLPDSIVGSESEFQRLLEEERRRSERSGRPIVLVRVQMGEAAAAETLLGVICDALRETDWIAWHEAGAAMGIICTETGKSNGAEAGAAISKRLGEILSGALPQKKRSRVSFESFQPQSRAGVAKVEADRDKAWAC